MLMMMMTGSRYNLFIGDKTASNARGIMLFLKAKVLFYPMPPRFPKGHCFLECSLASPFALL